MVKKPGGERRQVDRGPVEACSGSRSRETAYRTRGFSGITKKKKTLLKSRAESLTVVTT